MSDKPYTARSAKRLFLQAPLTALTLNNAGKGQGHIYVCEKTGSKESYNIILTIIKHLEENVDQMEDNSELLKDLMEITTTDAEKERLKYMASAVTNASRRQAS